MVSFSLRQPISYLLLQDPSLVSFHLIQFVDGDLPHRVLQFMVNMVNNELSARCEAENGIDAPAPEFSCAYE